VRLNKEAEALDMISALDTGHCGSITTVHANSRDELLWRPETLALSRPKSGSGFYSIEVGDRGELTFGLPELERSD
jgi:hypothetical protein